MRFYADEKYYAVREALLALGWELSEDANQTCDLLWTNLKSISFTERTYQIVNHFPGSQVFSNKAFFANSMHQSNNFACIPITWEFGSQSLLDLVRLVIAGDFCKISLTKNFKKEQLYLKELHQLASALQKPRSKQMAGEFRSQSCLSEITQWLKSLTIPRLFELIGQTSISGDIWIVKAIGLSCGQSIYVCSGLADVLQNLLMLQGRCIVQKYIERPLTVRGGFKFDIRQWVLVTSLSPITIYGFSEFYLRVSSTPFSLSSESFSNPLVHLTNFAVQKHAISNTVTENDPREDSVENNVNNMTLMMSMDEFQQDIQSRFSSNIFNHLYADIQRICLAGVLTCIDQLDQSASTEGCFEWLGLDLMVDDQFRVFLIEINTSPDISYSTAVTHRLVAAAVPAVISLVMFTDTAGTEDMSTTSLCWNKWYPPTVGNDAHYSQAAQEVKADVAHENNAQMNTSVYFRKSTSPHIVEAAAQLLHNIKELNLSLDTDAIDQLLLKAEEMGQAEESEEEDEI